MTACLLSDRAVLAVAGEDRIGFLQGLVSNDVSLAAPDRAVWAALLTPQGKWLADFFIVADPAAPRLLLDCEAGWADELARRLSRHRLRARVEVSRTPFVVSAGWNGTLPSGAVPDPRHADAGWRLIGPDRVGDGLEWKALAGDGPRADYDRRRIALGLPDGSRDMQRETSVLLEAGFDELNGISWTKGCYMGQELTARTRYRGLVKRRLIPVQGDGTVPVTGTVLSGPDGAEVGTMRSGAGDIGLALLRLGAWGRPVSAGAAVLTPMPPPWLRLPGAPENAAR